MVFKATELDEVSKECGEEAEEKRRSLFPPAPHHLIASWRRKSQERRWRANEVGRNQGRSWYLESQKAFSINVPHYYQSRLSVNTFKLCGYLLVSLQPLAQTRLTGCWWLPSWVAAGLRAHTASHYLWHQGWYLFLASEVWSNQAPPQILPYSCCTPSGPASTLSSWQDSPYSVPPTWYEASSFPPCHLDSAAPLLEWSSLLPVFPSLAHISGPAQGSVPPSLPICPLLWYLIGFLSGPPYGWHLFPTGLLKPMGLPPCPHI